MTSTEPLKKLDRGETLVERVVAQIQDSIFNGILVPGHRLPAERQLGEQLGVSRTVLRESLSALSAKGLIESAAGGGFVVATPTSGDLVPSLTLFLRSGQPHLDYAKVHEVRQLMEIEIAGFAATRRTSADLEQLEASLNEMKALSEPIDLEATAELDVQFHMLLARSAHNPLLWLLMETVSDIMREVRRIGSRVPGLPSRAIRHHTAILKAVRAGDPERAKEAMRLHLSESFKTMNRAMKKIASGDTL